MPTACLDPLKAVLMKKYAYIFFIIKSVLILGNTVPQDVCRLRLRLNTAFCALPLVLQSPSGTPFFSYVSTATQRGQIQYTE